MTVYFELPDLRRYQIATFEPQSGMNCRRLVDIRDLGGYVADAVPVAT